MRSLLICLASAVFLCACSVGTIGQGDGGEAWDDGDGGSASGDDGGGPGGDDGGSAGGDDGGGDAGSEEADWRIGPGRQYTTPCQVSALAQDGELIEVDAGLYPGDACVWRQNNLTLRGVGGLAHLRADGAAAEQKAIWVIKGSNTLVESFEFSLASVPDRNGAGIRQEGPGLTLRHCYFHDNENGLLAGDQSESDIRIEYCEFSRNGFGDGYSHNMYINHVRSFVLLGSYSHHAHIGHNVKSRAYANHILYNRIMDEVDGESSYAVDLPNGGESFLIGNLIQQGPSTDNSTIVSYGREGLSNPSSQLFAVNNTLVNDRSAGIFFNLQSGCQASLVNNLSVGNGTRVQGSAEEIASLGDDGSSLQDRSGFDYRLRAGTPPVDAGQAPGQAGGQDLQPDLQYQHPASTEARPDDGVLDVGAYEAIE